MRNPTYLEFFLYQVGRTARTPTKSGKGHQGQTCFRSTTANAPENDYMSDVASQSSRMYRSVSGHSLGELEAQQQEQARQVCAIEKVVTLI